MNKIIGTVVDVLPSYRLAHIKTANGWIYGLNAKTPGVVFESIKEGQQYECIMEGLPGHLIRVMHATLIKDVT